MNGNIMTQIFEKNVYQDIEIATLNTNFNFEKINNLILTYHH